MRILFFLLVATVAAQAQTTTVIGPLSSTAWTTTAGSFCYANGQVWPARGSVCLMEDANRLIPPTGGVTISNTPPHSCEDGWILVDAGRPMCARELREPVRK